MSTSLPFWICVRESDPPLLHPVWVIWKFIQQFKISGVSASHVPNPSNVILAKYKSLYDDRPGDNGTRQADDVERERFPHYSIKIVSWQTKHMTSLDSHFFCENDTDYPEAFSNPVSGDVCALWVIVEGVH